MVRYGAHAFVWIGDWDTEAGNATIRRAAETGFDFLEIPLLHPERFDAKSHKRVLAEAGIDAAVSLALPREVHMPDNPEGAKRFLRQVLNHMEELGSSYLAGCVGYALGSLTGAPPTPEERQAVVEGLQEIAEDAQRRGITLALEACNRYETHLYNTLKDTREAVLAIGAPNVQLHADTYHMNIEEESFYTPFVEAADVLGHVHMSESHRGLVGTGTVNWDEAFRGLKGANFSGNLVLESFAAINPTIAAATCLWRPTNQPPEVLATQGLAFLKAGAEKHGLA
jgi:D-psicose/D-tagatose/L-ribulose 3-epimerase